MHPSVKLPILLLTTCLLPLAKACSDACSDACVSFNRVQAGHPVSPLAAYATSSRLACASACLNRPLCLGWSLSGGYCSLWPTPSVENPLTEGTEEVYQNLRSGYEMTCDGTSWAGFKMVPGPVTGDR